jgi:hypothetical protein
MRWKRLTNQILTGNFKLGGSIMGMQETDLIIKTLKLEDIHGELGSIATHLNTSIFDLINALIRMGLASEHERFEVLSSPPHTPPFKNNIINNNNTKGVINKLFLKDLTKSHPIVSGKWPGDLIPGRKSPLEKKAERKNNRKPKNKTAMPKLWVDAREAGALHDEVLIDYGEKQGYDWYATKELFLSFVDYHMAKGSKFVKWNNAFYTWVRNDIKFNGPPAKKTSGVLQSLKTNQPFEGLWND